MSESELTSRIPGFYREPLAKRLKILVDAGVFSETSREYLERGGSLPTSIADRMSENVIACQSLPFSVALNFRVNHRDVLVPMAVEEPSIVAAASNAARLVRISGGFHGDADEPVMTTQVQLDEVPDLAQAQARLLAAKEDILRAGNEAIPRMVARGGGCVDLEVRAVDASTGMLVLHIYVNVRDAMGANLVDTVAEAVAPLAHAIVGGRIGLRILSNLPLRRLVRVRAKVSSDALGGQEAAEALVRASRFAEVDVFRAVTHNKGIMNGIDAVAVALGQDWRAIEAAAHAFAALQGTYRPLATWRLVDNSVEGRVELPLAVGAVGGSTQTHQGVRAAFELIRSSSAQEIAVIMASAGLATNLAALKALAGEGIQRGHMRLHHRKREAAQETSPKVERGGA